MNEIAVLKNFDVFPTQDILDYLFSFTATDSPGIGFESTGTSSKRVIPYLGSSIFIMMFILVQFLIFGLTYLLRK
jgi:hypothetical protein